MNSQNSLQRLNNIRQKYTGIVESKSLPKQHKDNKNMKSLYDLKMKKCQSIQTYAGKNIDFLCQNEDSREYEPFDRKITNSLGKLNFHKEQINLGRSVQKPNRKDFTSFIKQIDDKIMQKQRNLKHKLNLDKGNYQIASKGRFYQNEQEDFIQPTKIFRNPSQRGLIDRICDVAVKQNNFPQRPFERSSSKSSLKRLINEPFFTHSNSQPINVLSNQINYDFGQKLKADLKEKYIEQKLKVNGSQSYKSYQPVANKKYGSFKDQYSKKENEYSFLLQSKQNHQVPLKKQQFGHNNWSSNNLQKIQERIKSVLKVNNY